MAKKTLSMKDRLLRTLETSGDNKIKTGFTDIDVWCAMPNYAMNRRWSGKWDKAFLFGRNYVMYGESGSGKSVMLAYAAADAQRRHGALVYWLDSEHANDGKAGQEWFARLGLDLDNMVYFGDVRTMEQAKTIIAKTCNEYQKMMDDGVEESEPLTPIVFVVDSWAALLTDSQDERVTGKEAGKVVGDMGQKAKQLGDLILAVTHLCAGKPIMCLGVQHIMDNQDGHGRRHKTTGGHKILYYASGAMLLTKSELKKEDLDSKELREEYLEQDSKMSAEVKKKLSQTVGITSRMEIIKSRVSKPFESVYLQIPYNGGMDPYSGLFELLMQEGVITVSAKGWYQFTDTKGEVVKFQKGKFHDHADEMMRAADMDISGSDAISIETPAVEEATA